MSEKKNKIKISIAVITYNQEDTIAQTLDSILMQQGDFDLELVIGEDCSTDNTLAICQEYVAKSQMTNHQSQIVLLSGPKNLGITANYFRTLLASTGDYICSISGDDYYIDDHALEKQMSYLEQHPAVGFMGANGYRYYVRRNERIAGLNPVVDEHTCRAKEFYFSADYPGGVYIRPIGTMIRREMLQYINFDEILRRKLPVEDYPMQAIWSQHTQFACLPDLLVTYRVYNESATFISFDHPKYMQYHHGLAETRRYLNELFPNDACITESQLQEYEFYKEFLLYLHQLDYRKAKSLTANHSSLIDQGAKVKQAKRFSKSRLRFIAAHYIKEYNYRKDLQKRV